MSSTLTPHTYVPDDADTAELDEVRSFLATHDGTAHRLLLVGDGEQVELPRQIHEALKLVAESLAAGRGVTVAPESTLLTTQHAADLLGVSRPTVVRLADNRQIPSERYGNRRRIRLGDLLDYRPRRRREQYDALAATSVALDAEDDPDVVHHELRAARRAVAERRRRSDG